MLKLVAMHHFYILQVDRWWKNTKCSTLSLCDYHYRFFTATFNIVRNYTISTNFLLPKIMLHKFRSGIMFFVQYMPLYHVQPFLDNNFLVAKNHYSWSIFFISVSHSISILDYFTAVRVSWCLLFILCIFKCPILIVRFRCWLRFRLFKSDIRGYWYGRGREFYS